MPRNVFGKPVDPTEWNRNDGFSPGQLIVAFVPGIAADPASGAVAGAPPITDVSRSLEPQSPVLVVKVPASPGREPRPHPIWVEIDANADLLVRPRIPQIGLDVEPVERPEGGRPALLIRPARNFELGARYVVVLRNLRDPSVALRLSPWTGSPKTRIPRLHAASREPSRRRGCVVPADPSPLESPAIENFWQKHRGAFPAAVAAAVDTARLRLPPNRLFYDPIDGPDPRFGDDLPDRTGELLARFVCNVPRAALGGKDFATATPADLRPARPSLYGHGLLGSRTEVNSRQVRSMGQGHDILFGATDGFGFSSGDLANVLSVTVDLSLFAVLPDATQQGFLNQVFLARELAHPLGFAAHPAFQVSGTAVFDSSAGVYDDGNSQGGILGGDRNLLLLHPAFGDHQVTMWSAEVMAGTIEGPVDPWRVDPERHPDTVECFGIPLLKDRGEATLHDPHDGSALVVWDQPWTDSTSAECARRGETGVVVSQETPPPPTNETPPRQGSDPPRVPPARDRSTVPEIAVPETGWPRGGRVEREESSRLSGPAELTGAGRPATRPPACGLLLDEEEATMPTRNSRSPFDGISKTTSPGEGSCKARPLLAAPWPWFPRELQERSSASLSRRVLPTFRQARRRSIA
jgi:hypothetical protein